MIDKKDEISISEMLVFTLGMLGVIAAICLILWKIGNIKEIPSDSPNTFAECNYRAVKLEKEMDK